MKRFLMVIVIVLFGAVPAFAGETWEALQNQAVEAYSQAYYNKAILAAEKAVKAGEKEKDNLHTAASLQVLGNAYYMALAFSGETIQGYKSNAIDALKRAAALFETKLGPDSPKIAECLTAMVWIKDDDKEFVTPLLSRALAINQKAYGPESAQVATTIGALAWVTYITGKQGEAAPLFEKSINLLNKLAQTTTDKEARPDIIKGLIKVFYYQAWSLTGNCDTHPEGVCQEGHAIYEKIIPAVKKHPAGPLPDAANYLTNYAFDFKDSASRIKYVKEALEFREEKLGPQHPMLISPLYTLGDIYEYDEQAVIAEPYYKRALEIQEKALGPDHPALGATLKRLSWVNHMMQNNVSAKKYALRARDVYRKAHNNSEAGTAEMLLKKYDSPYVAQKK